MREMEKNTESSQSAAFWGFWRTGFSHRAGPVNGGLEIAYRVCYNRNRLYMLKEWCECRP